MFRTSELNIKRIMILQYKTILFVISISISIFLIGCKTQVKNDRIHMARQFKLKVKEYVKINDGRLNIKKVIGDPDWWGDVYPLTNRKNSYYDVDVSMMFTGQTDSLEMTGKYYWVYELDGEHMACFFEFYNDKLKKIFYGSIFSIYDP